ncbi:unnamed protein product [Albugo candida]|uniref:Uncharacterized protein n=1 Tax=Albugo candida TaxID=65357 RepID=A0A024G6N9_9STRA|nr:unnamed protein product [Albugo candida]|eukprot:CCI42387.1 unnamed protein product [Albugo candida]
MSSIEAEYEAEVGYKKVLLSRMGIEEGNLSVNGRLYLRTLTETAILLQLKNVHTSSYLSAITGLEEKLQSATEEAVESQHRIDRKLLQQKQLQSDFERLGATEGHLTIASREREEMEHSLTMEKRCDEVEMEIEARRKQVLALEASLSQIGFFHEFESKCDHDAIVELENKLEADEREIQHLKKQLDEYSDLPLDLNKAKIALARATEELSELELQFDRRIQEMI